MAFLVEMAFLVWLELLGKRETRVMMVDQVLGHLVLLVCQDNKVKRDCLVFLERVVLRAILADLVYLECKDQKECRVCLD